MSITVPVRVLALEIRSRIFGYIVLEGSNKALDYGVRTYRVLSNNLLKRRVEDLCSLFNPKIILIRDPLFSGRNRNVALRTLKVLGRKTFTRVLLIRRRRVRERFPESVNKQQIACLIASQFPDLSWRLPPVRKPWLREPRRQTIFDAASAGLAYFAERQSLV